MNSPSPTRTTLLIPKISPQSVIDLEETMALTQNQLNYLSSHEHEHDNDIALLISFDCFKITQLLKLSFVNSKPDWMNDINNDDITTNNNLNSFCERFMNYLQPMVEKRIDNLLMINNLIQYSDIISLLTMIQSFPYFQEMIHKANGPIITIILIADRNIIRGEHIIIPPLYQMTSLYY